MAGTAVIALHEPWLDDEGHDVLGSEATGVSEFMTRNRYDVLLMVLMVLTAVGAGLVARVLCGV